MCAGRQVCKTAFSSSIFTLSNPHIDRLVEKAISVEWLHAEAPKLIHAMLVGIVEKNSRSALIRLIEPAKAKIPEAAMCVHSAPEEPGFELSPQHHFELSPVSSCPRSIISNCPRSIISNCPRFRIVPAASFRIIHAASFRVVPSFELSPVSNCPRSIISNCPRFRIVAGSPTSSWLPSQKKSSNNLHDRPAQQTHKSKTRQATISFLPTQMATASETKGTCTRWKRSTSSTRI